MHHRHKTIAPRQALNHSLALITAAKNSLRRVFANADPGPPLLFPRLTAR